MTVKDANTWIVTEALVGPSAVTADNQGAAVEVEELPERPMFVLVINTDDAVAGNTYDLTIEGRDDPSDSWTAIGSFTQVAGDGASAVVVQDLQDLGHDTHYRYYRVNETVSTGAGEEFNRTVLIVGDELGRAGGQAVT